MVRKSVISTSSAQSSTRTVKIVHRFAMRVVTTLIKKLAYQSAEVSFVANLPLLPTRKCSFMLTCFHCASRLSSRP